MLEKKGNFIFFTRNKFTVPVPIAELSAIAINGRINIFKGEEIVVSFKKGEANFTVEEVEALQKVEIVEGEKGDRGDTGIKGADGKDGIDGLPGKDGTDGKDGVNGKDGNNGKDGSNGDNGAKGDVGLIGEKGINGKDGLSGITGDKGEKGQPGTKGLRGDKGQSGNDGLTGLSFRWRGLHTQNNAYTVNDVVRDPMTNNDFICIQNAGKGITVQNAKFWELFLLAGRGIVGPPGKDGLPLTFEEQSFDVTNDSLPITVANNISVLNVDFDNFDADIDLTGQLPTNLIKGSKVTLRKIDNTLFKILFDEGVVLYDFINSKGDFITLYWNGTKYII